MPELPTKDRVRIQHMRDAALKARKWTEGRKRQDLDDDEQLSLALQRLIEIIGEAAKNVSDETRASANAVPWPKIAGMRDRLIHAYFDVDLDILWTTVTEDLPRLMVDLDSLLSADPSTEH